MNYNLIFQYIGEILTGIFLSLVTIFLLSLLYFMIYKIWPRFHFGIPKTFGYLQFYRGKLKLPKKLENSGPENCPCSGIRLCPMEEKCVDKCEYENNIAGTVEEILFQKYRIKKWFGISYRHKPLWWFGLMMFDDHT